MARADHRHQRRHQLDRGVSDRRRALRSPQHHRAPSGAARIADDGRPATPRTTSRTSSSARRFASWPKARAAPPLACASRRSCPTRRTRAVSGPTPSTSTRSLLGAKTVQSIRIVGNIGVGILARSDQRRTAERRAHLRGVARTRGDPAGRVRRRAERPRVDAKRDAFPGTETQRADEARRSVHAGPAPARRRRLFFGMTSVDPTVGFTTGFTYVFDAFKVP